MIKMFVPWHSSRFKMISLSYSNSYFIINIVNKIEQEINGNVSTE